MEPGIPTGRPQKMNKMDYEGGQPTRFGALGFDSQPPTAISCILSKSTYAGTSFWPSISSRRALHGNHSVPDVRLLVIWYATIPTIMQLQEFQLDFLEAS